MQEQVSVYLGSDINYVYGTVNGAVVNFSLTAPNTWTATTDKANDGKYVISVTAYNSLGTSNTVNTVVYSLEGLITPKIDWTSFDIYNIEDLNRVEANIEKTLQELKFFNQNIAIQNCIVNRDYTRIEFDYSLNRIESNIEALKNFFYEPDGWIQSKTNWEALDTFSYIDANRLEVNIKLLYELIQKAKVNLQYCGTINCGQDTRIF